jgi:hypothetical protein
VTRRKKLTELPHSLRAAYKIKRGETGERGVSEVERDKQTIIKFLRICVSHLPKEREAAAARSHTDPLLRTKRTLVLMSSEARMGTAPPQMGRTPKRTTLANCCYPGRQLTASYHHRKVRRLQTQIRFFPFVVQQEKQQPSLRDHHHF